MILLFPKLKTFVSLSLWLTTVLLAQAFRPTCQKCLTFIATFNQDARLIAILTYELRYFTCSLVSMLYNANDTEFKFA